MKKAVQAAVKTAVRVNPGKYAPLGKSKAPKKSPTPATTIAHGAPSIAAAKAVAIKAKPNR